MLIRQLFDYETYTYTYLLADEISKDAVLIDPVLGKIDSYIQLLNELQLNLTFALDTHVHADHITALGALRETLGCVTYLGNHGDIDCADNGLNDNQVIKMGELEIHVLFTPGHTDDSYSFYIKDGEQGYVFTGDTLLIRGSGRTDFQNGNPETLYESLHNVLLKLPGETIVYPGHDYRGNTVSTIAEEKRHNPRVNIVNKSDFIAHMNNLNLPDPKWMDVAVPANRACGNR